MANIKITDLNNFADPNSTDVLPIVDVANDETKKVSIGNLMKSAVAGTAALPGVAFAVDEDTGMYRNASDQLAFATGGVERILIDDNGDVTISGSLTVNGTTTTIDSTTLTVEDKNIELGVVDTPSDTTADGGGITLKGATDKTLNWVDSTDSWTSSENVDLASGKTYKIAGTDVLSGSTLGSGVTGSSLTSVGTITTGVWNGTALTADAIGADAINGDKIADDSIDSEHYVDGSIDNVHVSASAAIAGTKISADFGAQDLTVDTNVLHVDATNDRVGVGTSSPGARLQIEEASPADGILLYLNNDVNSSGSEAGFRIRHNDTDQLECNVLTERTGLNAGLDFKIELSDGAGTVQERFRVTETGNVGVGTAIPGCLLDVQGSAPLLRVRATDTSSARIRITAEPTQNSFLEFGDTDDSDVGEIVYQHASNNMLFNTAAAEAFRIDSSGRLLVGTNTNASGQQLQVEGLTAADGVSIRRNQAGSAAASLIISKSRGTATGSRTSVADGDTLGIVSFRGADGTGDIQAAAVSAAVDGTPGTNEMPGRLVFSTNDGTTSAAPTERMRISANGNITVDTDTFFVDAVNDRVGINNTSPGDRLEITPTQTRQGLTIKTTGQNFGGINIDTNRTSAETTLGDIGFLWDGTRVAAIVAQTGSDTTNKDDAHLVFRTSSADNLTERMRIDSEGRVGIGNNNPGDYSAVADDLVVGNHSGAHGITIAAENNNTGYLRFADGTANSGQQANGSIQYSHADLSLRFNVDASERVRIDSGGRLLVGTSSARGVGGSITGDLYVEGNSVTQAVVINNENSATGPSLRFGKSRGTTSGSNTVVQAADTLGYIIFAGADGTDLVSSGALIKAEVDGTPGANDMPGRLVFSTTADGASSPTERMRIDNAGNIIFNGEDVTFGVGAGQRAGYNPVSGYFMIQTYQSDSLRINRNGNDGILARFYQANTQEGNISVSGTTVSYNGAHLARWSQLPGGVERTEILRGSVLSNIDEMCEWGEEENEQLNRMKVSDVEGDKNVSGVFQAWDDDDDTYTNDFYCAMTGDFVIRIAQGVTVERGDLLMSAGDGTAKPQDDDIIRSKTIAKVTSTNVSCTYDDGSYCVPCVLMAC